MRVPNYDASGVSLACLYQGAWIAIPLVRKLRSTAIEILGRRFSIDGYCWLDLVAAGSWATFRNSECENIHDEIRFSVQENDVTTN